MIDCNFNKFLILFLFSCIACGHFENKDVEDINVGKLEAESLKESVFRSPNKNMSVDIFVDSLRELSLFPTKIVVDSLVDKLTVRFFCDCLGNSTPVRIVAGGQSTMPLYPREEDGNMLGGLVIDASYYRKYVFSPKGFSPLFMRKISFSIQLKDKESQRLNSHLVKIELLYDKSF